MKVQAQINRLRESLRRSPSGRSVLKRIGQMAQRSRPQEEKPKASPAAARERAIASAMAKPPLYPPKNLRKPNNTRKNRIRTARLSRRKNR